MIIRPLFVFARFPPRISIILFEWIITHPGKESPLKRKFAKNNFAGNQKKLFLPENTK